MMTTTSGRTLERRLRTWAVAGIGICGVYTMYLLATNLNEWSKYNRREDAVIELINDGKIDKARKLVTVYATNKLLIEGDIELLRNKIKRKVTYQHLSTLDAKIAKLDFEGAQSLYQKLASEGVISNKRLVANYKDRIAQLEPGKILERITALEGEEKIELTNKFTKQYPKHPKVRELRAQQFNTYLSLATSHFTMKTNEAKVLNFLKKFKEWSTKYGSYAIKPDFSTFKKESEFYIARKSEVPPYNMKKGDRVVIVQALGGLLQGEPDEYYHGTEVKEIPVGTKGVIGWAEDDKFRVEFFGKDGKLYGNLKERKNASHYFTRRELKHASSVILPEIKEYVKGIINHYKPR